MLKNFIASLSVLFALTGCIINPPPTTSSASQHAAASGPRTLRLTTLVNQPLIIDRGVLLNPDCSVRGYPTTRVLQQPAHGTITFSQQEDFTAYPGTNIHSVCNKYKRIQHTVIYTPESNFVGSDTVLTETISPEGFDYTVNNYITVK